MRSRITSPMFVSVYNFYVSLVYITMINFIAIFILRFSAFVSLLYPHHLPCLSLSRTVFYRPHFHLRVYARVLLRQFFLFLLIVLICDYLRYLNGFAFMTIIITAENNSYIQKSQNVYFIQILLVHGTTHSKMWCVCVRFYVCSMDISLYSYFVCVFFFISVFPFNTKMTLNNSVLAL